MSTAHGHDEVAPAGRAEARYLAFLETITHLRPSLHRYCARMTGSALDGEDVVQEALFQAYRKLDSFDDTRPLAAWLFRIAHNRCIDFLRRRGTRERAEAETSAGGADSTPAVEPIGAALGHAIERLVVTLPPKERACVLLKDVFDYSLEEIAELVESTIGGVKSALTRGRAKLAATSAPDGRARAQTRGDTQLLQLYVDRFNERDWAGLRELIAADAQLKVADRYVGEFDKTPYLAQYERRPARWRAMLGEVDGEPAMMVLDATRDGWLPQHVVRLRAMNGRIVGITDYWHCSWLLPAARTVSFDPPNP